MSFTKWKELEFKMQLMEEFPNKHLLDVQNPLNNGINYQPQLVSRISSIRELVNLIPAISQRFNRALCSEDPITRIFWEVGNALRVLRNGPQVTDQHCRSQAEIKAFQPFSFHLGDALPSSWLGQFSPAWPTFPWLGIWEPRASCVLLLKSWTVDIRW